MGPTASGKTALSVAMARHMNAEIVSVDSALVYRGMDIGTAKPGLAERGGVAHHLLDILDPSQAYSTGQFRDQSLALIADIHRRGKIPLLTGGTMLYFSALTQGLAQLPAADPVIRRQLDEELKIHGKQALHARLEAVDPQAAARIHVNDPQRIQRALEVYAISGRPLSSFLQGQTAEPAYQWLKIIIAPAQRATLHRKIAERFTGMLEQGLIGEVDRLRQRGDLDVSMPALRCVGYRQVWGYLQGDDDFDAMQDKAIAATRQLAKRQFTWLRKETDALWLDNAAPDLLAQALRYCRNDLFGAL
jgi:tRNA dimethylallyltransferase